MANGSPNGPIPPTPPSSPTNPGMIGRIQRLILTPKAEWIAIDAEPMSERQIMTDWVMPLAAIGPVCRLIGSLVFGYGSFGIVFRPSVAAAVILAVVSYVVTVVGTWILAKIIDALAPSFAAMPDPVSAMKVAAYSSTAAWLAGIFGLIPSIWFLSIVGVYSLYLLYVGLPLLMRVPPARTTGYAIASILAAIVLFVVIGEIGAAITVRMLAPTFVSYGGV